MLKKITISSILFVHTFCSFLYFWRVSHDTADQKYWHSFGWTVFFDCSMMFPLIALAFFTAFIPDRERSFFDKQFLLLEALFSGSLFAAFLLDYYGFIQHTYGYQISIGGVSLATLFIILAFIKHGYHKN